LLASARGELRGRDQGAAKELTRSKRVLGREKGGGTGHRFLALSKMRKGSCLTMYLGISSSQPVTVGDVVGPVAR
jgi:hypothetical protein